MKLLIYENSFHILPTCTIILHVEPQNKHFLLIGWMNYEIMISIN